MKSIIKLTFLAAFLLILTSCVSKKEYENLQGQLQMAKQEAGQTSADIARISRELSSCEQEKARLGASLSSQAEKVVVLREQVEDLKLQRNQTVQQVGDLTVLSQSANANISETLSQLERKDKYIQLLQAAKTKADSINLALAVNLKSVLPRGLEDEDVEVKVDKTVVFINLSDKMLFQSGSYNITTRADEVLGKIATILQSRPDVEMMIEGYTDNVPISTACIKDNWELSVLRATSVAKALQNKHGVDPNRIIAAGRGQYNALADNATAEGRATNRRTRIIIMPKLDQFYDLLNPSSAPK